MFMSLTQGGRCGLQDLVACEAAGSQIWTATQWQAQPGLRCRTRNRRGVKTCNYTTDEALRYHGLINMRGKDAELDTSTIVFRLAARFSIESDF